MSSPICADHVPSNVWPSLEGGQPIKYSTFKKDPLSSWYLPMAKSSLDRGGTWRLPALAHSGSLTGLSL